MAVSKTDWSAGASSSSRGGSGGSGRRGRGSYFERMNAPPGPDLSRRTAIQNVQEREERSQASMSKVPLPGMIAALNIGSAMRQNIIRQIEAGGTPVRENGMVIGVMRNGVYTGRQREAERQAMQAANADQSGSQAAQMGAAAPQPQQPAEAAGPATVRRSALAQQIEAENRRRRAAGLRRLGARTLLSGDRFTADTLGAG